MIARPEKPPHGDTCNSCGLCCEDQLCPLAERVGIRSAPCPILEEINDGSGRRMCGLVLHPERWTPTRTRRFGRYDVSETARIVIGAGVGCDAFEKPEDRNIAASARIEDEAIRQRVKQGKRVWRIWRD